MRAEGVEPTRSFEHRDLNPACLPVPARPQAGRVYDGPAAGHANICSYDETAG
jgi:hypothetical protein